MACVRPLLALIVALTAAGCGPRLRYEKEVEIPPDGWVVDIDPFKTEQKVTIRVQAPKAPVDLYVYTERTRDVAEENVFAKESEGFLAHKRGEQNHEITIAAPANELLFVRIHRSGWKSPGEVKVKITN